MNDCVGCHGAPNNAAEACRVWRRHGKRRFESVMRRQYVRNFADLQVKESLFGAMTGSAVTVTGICMTQQVMADCELLACFR